MSLLHTLFAMLLLATTAIAAPPTPDDFVCIVTDGDTNLGSFYIRANRTWGQWFTEMEQYDHLIVHLPFGNDDRPMQFCSRSLLEGRAAADPDNADLQAKADVAAFTAALLARTKWVGVYVGGIDTLVVKKGETPQQWCDRALAELQPYLDGVPDAMFFDATLGPRRVNEAHEAVVWGVGGGCHLLFNQLALRGIEVVVEPAVYEDYPLLHESDYPMLYDTAFLMTDQYWFGKEVPAAQRKILGLPGGGDSRWDTGSFAARPFHRPTETERVYRLIYHQSKTPGEYERFVKLARRDGHVPCIRWLDLHYGKVTP